MIFKRKIGLWGRTISPWFLNFIDGITAKRIVNALTLFVLFAGITCFATSGNTRLDRYMTFTYAVVAALGLQLSLRSLPVGLFLIWTAISFYIHPLTPILAALTTVLYGGGLLLLTRVSISRQSIYNLICCYAIATVLWQVLQITDLTFGYRPIYGGSYTIVGLQTNVNETSALMAICLPAFFRRHWVWFLPVPIAGLIMAESLIGIMAAFVIGSIYILSQWNVTRPYNLIIPKSGLIFLLLVAGIGYMIFIDKFSFESQKNSRLQTWKESTVIALEKPFRGWGYGQFCTVVPLLSTPTQLLVDDRKRLYAEVEDKGVFLTTANKITGGNAAAYYQAKKYPDHFYFEAHNEYVEVLFAAGIPGLVLLIFALAHILRSGWKKTDRIPFYGLFASCTAATVFSIWQIVPIGVVTVIWAGLCLKGSMENGAESRGLTLSSRLK